MIADQIDVLGEHGSYVNLIVLGNTFEGDITSTNSYVEFLHTEDALKVIIQIFEMFKILLFKNIGFMQIISKIKINLKK